VTIQGVTSALSFARKKMNALNIQEVAAHLKVHPKTAEKMARDGVIPAAKIGLAYVVISLGKTGG